MPFKIVRNDITKMNTEAIVNTANDHATVGTGCDYAVYMAAGYIANVHKYARDEDRPEKTLFVITTDGMENASKHYTYEKVQAMIKKEQERYGWEFIFIGANIDAVQEAKRFGIRKERAVNYVHDEIGTKTVYRSVSKAVCAMRMADVSGARSAIDECAWEEDINMDYNRRSNKGGGRGILS